MSDQTPEDQLLATLRQRETNLVAKRAEAQRLHDVAIAAADARLDEVRELIEMLTDGRRRPRRKVVEDVAEGVVEVGV